MAHRQSERAAPRRRPGAGSSGPPRPAPSPRWLVRLLLILAVGFAALVYLMDLDPSRMLRYLGGSMLFIGACALLALATVAAIKLVKR